MSVILPEVNLVSFNSIIKPNQIVKIQKFIICWDECKFLSFPVKDTHVESSFPAVRHYDSGVLYLWMHKTDFEYSNKLNFSIGNQRN